MRRWSKDSAKSAPERIALASLRLSDSCARALFLRSKFWRSQSHSPWIWLRYFSVARSRRPSTLFVSDAVAFVSSASAFAASLPVIAFRSAVRFFAASVMAC